MAIKRIKAQCLTLRTLVSLILTSHSISQVQAQPIEKSIQPDSFKYSTPIQPGVAIPNQLDTSVGTLNLIDGFPLPDTVEKIYDNLDRSRALQAYLKGGAK